MTKTKSTDTLTYEDALTELEAIVTTLENDEHSLEESMDLFERSQALARHCAALLDRADLKVKQLIEGELETIDT